MGTGKGQSAAPRIAPRGQDRNRWLPGRRERPTAAPTTVPFRPGGAALIYLYRYKSSLRAIRKQLTRAGPPPDSVRHLCFAACRRPCSAAPASRRVPPGAQGSGRGRQPDRSPAVCGHHVDRSALPGVQSSPVLVRIGRLARPTNVKPGLTSPTACPNNRYHFTVSDSKTVGYKFSSNRLLPWRQSMPLGLRRVRRLLYQIGMAATDCRPRYSEPHRVHRVYPDLRRHLRVQRAHHVWCVDSTCIQLQQGYLYRMVVMDGPVAACGRMLRTSKSNMLHSSYLYGRPIC